MFRTSAATGLTIGTLLALCPGASGQVNLSINTAEHHQRIEGWGVMGSATWEQQIRDLYTQPQFAARLRDDLGINMLRLEIPPYIEPGEGLDPTVLEWWRFDFTSCGSQGGLAHNLNDGHPGAVKILGALWSPPWWMKTNQQVIGGGYLRTDRYPHFGKYCAMACMGFEYQYGVPIYALSIQNEPVFAEPYESCVYTPEQYRDTIHAVAGAFDYWNVNVKLFGSEDVGTDPYRWFTYVSAMQADPVAMAAMDAWAVHHYPWQNSAGESSPIAWNNLRTQLAPIGKPLWQTERSGEAPTWPWVPGVTYGGFYVAVEIHDALVYGDVTAWLYWGISSVQPDEFSLMALDVPTSKYYACKQFFRYIRPGSVRVGTSPDTQTIRVSAFVDEDRQQVTTVLLNSGEAQTVHLNVTGPVGVAGFTPVRTSETENTVQLPSLPVVGGQVDVTLPAESVVTLVSWCYPNCDGSAAAPSLNVLDFTCFVQKFASGDPYANCDGSTTPPVLNYLDFTCFLQRFAAGCPQ